MVLREKFPNVQGLIFDMDGVLWKDTTPLFDLGTFFEKLKTLEYMFTFATNNAIPSLKQVQDKLKKFGIHAELEQIITSSLATVHYLKKRFPEGGPVYVVGESGLVETLANEGFYLAEDHALAVIAGLDRQLTYEKIKRATLLIRKGALFVGTNPDRTFPTPAGLVPGGGAVIASIEAACDVKPIFIGKPFPAMMNMALEVMTTTPETSMVVGDRLDTDILAGQNVKCKTALVLSGVTTQEELEKWVPQPDLVLPRADFLLE